MAVNSVGPTRFGGWALSKTNCPDDTTKCGNSWCCPNSSVCDRLHDENIANVCCPSDDRCHSSFKQIALCADTTWSLWNSTTTEFKDGYFCCEPGQIGLQTGNCIAPDTYIATNPSAVLIAPGATQTTCEPAAPASSTSDTCDCPTGTSSPSSTGIPELCPTPSPNSNADAPSVCPGQDTGPIIAAGVLGGITLALLCAVLYLYRRLYLLGNTRAAPESAPPYQPPERPQWAAGQWPQWSPTPDAQPEGSESDRGMLPVHAVIPQMHIDSKRHPMRVTELDTDFRNELES